MEMDYNKLKKLTKGFVKYNPLIPLSKRERTNYLEKFEESVNRISPLIGERTGVEMGEVKIKEYKHLMDYLVMQIKNNLKYDEEFNLFQKSLSISLLNIGKPLFEITRMYQEEFCLAAHINSNIYIATGLTAKRRLFGESLLDELYSQVDQITIHELTHHLWEKVGSDFKNTNPSKKLWAEGFATYGESVWFSDFNQGLRREISLKTRPKEYVAGKWAIETIVNKYGEKILLEIPKNWEEFNRELFGENEKAN